MDLDVSDRFGRVKNTPPIFDLFASQVSPGYWTGKGGKVSVWKEQGGVQSGEEGGGDQNNIKTKTVCVCVCLCESLPGIYMCEIMSLDGPLRCGIVPMAHNPPSLDQTGNWTTMSPNKPPKQRNSRSNAHNGRTSEPIDGQQTPGPDRTQATIECELEPEPNEPDTLPGPGRGTQVPPSKHQPHAPRTSAQPA